MVLNKCIRPYEINNNDHRVAEEKCRSHGGTLATINNAIENRAIADLASTSFTRLSQSSIKIGVYCFGNDTSSCYSDNSTGSPLTYSNFASGYPLVTGSNSGCVSMWTSGSQAGKWFSSACNVGLESYFCEVTPIIGVESVVDCQIFGDFCYFSWTNTFDEIENWCRDPRGGHVASINSIHEMDFIRYHVSSNFTGYIILGAKELYPNSYVWVDGTSFNTFNNLDPLDPYDASLNCLKMNVSTQLWSRTSCTNDANLPVACKIPNSISKYIDHSRCNSTLMAPVTIESNAGLPVDWTPCTWRVFTPAPYKLRISFLDGYNTATIYDDDGNQIANGWNRNISVITQVNAVTIVQNSDFYFKATIQPY